MTLPVSNTLQDYLEAILILNEQDEAVRISDLAQLLGITKPSVTEGVKALAAQGLLKHEKYGPVFLTAKGKKMALEVRHRHLVLRQFLINVLGVSPSLAEKDACLMEHAVSSDTVARLVQFMEERLQESLSKK
ncbi:MAG: metal-dependent transcriptional regulator [Bacillota bacterium]